MEGAVTCVIPWIRALPDRVAFGSLSTELGDVKICLYACDTQPAWLTKVIHWRQHSLLRAMNCEEDHARDHPRHNCTHGI